ncbi:HNH endonuclease [Arthrobacter sp. I2-34]|uniref:HNH endonuclease n=1 Tax=Arthrobacter hankyongi TaxID=2904801 RepID=A0ABS9L176_9MICC|nr:HNH endonuclease signature motif containing protein [Arthrobacter hankyongi]MCG2620294.1 HNH endonuclease [Arthrobacter hankyongi]
MTGNCLPEPDPPAEPGGGPAAGPAPWELEFILRWGDPGAPIPEDPMAGCPDPGRRPQDWEDPDAWDSEADFDLEDLSDDVWDPDDSIPATCPLEQVHLLATVLPHRLDYRQAARQLEEARKADAWLQARIVRLAHRLAQTAVQGLPAPCPGMPERARANASELARKSATAELARLLSIPEGTACVRLEQARDLCTSLPATLAALESGEITGEQAAVIADQAATIPVSSRPAFEAVLLPGAMKLDRPALRKKARRQAERLNPEPPAVRRNRAEAGRRVELTPQSDGMAYIGAVLPAETAYAIYDRITRAAKSLQCAEETRTLAQLRPDVFADLLINGGMDAGPAAGIRAEVMVTVPVFTLLGLDEEPAELEGYGPVPADVARVLCANAPSFHRVLTHPETGVRLSWGRTTYRVPQDLARVVRHRHPVCTFAGCRRGAGTCELDHTVAFADGGETALDNLGPACKHHHRLKHMAGWMAAQSPGGNFTWISPAGYPSRTVPDHLGDGPPHYPEAVLKHLPAEHRRRLLRAAEELRNPTEPAPPGPPETGALPDPDAPPPF